MTKNLNWLERFGYSFVHDYLISNLPPLIYQRLTRKLVDLSTLPAPSNTNDSEPPSTTSTLPPSIESSTSNEILPSSATSSTLNIPEILINDQPAQVEIHQES